MRLVIRRSRSLRRCRVRCRRGAERPPLVDAAKNADTDAVRALLQKGASVNAAEADGTTALHWASYRDDLESADLLIRAGANVNAANDLGATPLWTASLNGSAAMVRSAAGGRRESERGAPAGRDAADGRRPLRAIPTSSNSCSPRARNVNARGARGQTALMWAVAQKHPDVVKVLLAHGADVHARSDVWSEVMAVPPHGYLEYNRAIPHGGDTALMFAARVGDLGVGEAAGGRRRQRERRGCLGRQRHGAGRARRLSANWSSFCSTTAPTRTRPRPASPRCTRRSCGATRRWSRALLAHGADANAPLRTWTPTRRSSHDFNFSPELVGATPFWLAARFSEPGRHAASGGARRRSAVRAPRRSRRRRRGGTGFQHRARRDDGADGGGRDGRRDGVGAARRGEREALTLEAVKLAVELGVDVNAANTDGRTALDAARALKYESVVKYLNRRARRAGAHSSSRGSGLGASCPSVPVPSP